MAQKGGGLVVYPRAQLSQVQQARLVEIREERTELTDLYSRVKKGERGGVEEDLLHDLFSRISNLRIRIHSKDPDNGVPSSPKASDVETLYVYMEELENVLASHS